MYCPTAIKSCTRRPEPSSAAARARVSVRSGTFWDAIGDYEHAGRPENIESWLDGWIQEAVGTDWTSMDWARDAHAAAIRDHFRISA